MSVDIYLAFRGTLCSEHLRVITGFPTSVHTEWQADERVDSVISIILHIQKLGCRKITHEDRNDSHMIKASISLFCLQFFFKLGQVIFERCIYQKKKKT